MKKITKLISAAIVLFAVNMVNAQNLIPDCYAGGATGANTEANKYGFGSSYTGATWGIAGGAGIRYRDNSGVPISTGGTFTGREFLYRWDGSYIGSVMSLGVPHNKGVDATQDGIYMEVGKEYTVTGLYAWLNNGIAPTYEFAFSNSASGAALGTPGSFPIALADKNKYFPFTYKFTPTTTGFYFFQIRQSNGLVSSDGGIILLGNLSITSATLGLNKAQSLVSSNIETIGDEIYVSNVKTSTEVAIYSLTGALVKKIKTNDDTNFNFKSGVWIATIKTNEGQKSVKLLVK